MKDKTPGGHERRKAAAAQMIIKGRRSDAGGVGAEMSINVAGLSGPCNDGAGRGIAQTGSTRAASLRSGASVLLT